MTLRSDTGRIPFIFTHIPKTGGTSVRARIHAAAVEAGIETDHIHVPGYGGIPHNQNTDVMSSTDMNKLKQRRLLCLADHGVYGVHERLSMHGAAYFTLLRNPIWTAVSYYYQTMSRLILEADQKHLEYYRARLSESDFGALLAWRTVPNINRCPRAILLAVVGDKEQSVLFYLGLPYAQSSVAEACRCLRDEYCGFGLLEHMAESLQILRAVGPPWLNGINTIPHHLNRGDYPREPLVSGVETLLRETAAYDLEIYAWAMANFDAIYRASQR